MLNMNLYNNNDFLKDFLGWKSDDTRKMKTDIIEKDEKFIISAELTGFNKNEISVNVKDHVLKIIAEKKENDEKNIKFILNERCECKRQRFFSLPTNVDEKSIRAKLNNGILTVTINKIETKFSNQINII